MSYRLSDAILDLRRVFLLLRKMIGYGLFPFADRVPFFRTHGVIFAVRLRRAIEDLGLTYLKLGQFLALRFDILPADVCEELGRLFETVKPLPPESTRAIIEADLGGPLEDLFVDFNLNAIAAASVSQVHRALTLDGNRVAVKVQRPGLEPVFKADIRNLLRLARLIEWFGLFGKLSATGMIREFAEWTLRELDFTIEGRTADRLREKMPPFVMIPHIFWNLTTPRVLTMEFIDGISASHLATLMENGGMDAVQSRMPNLDLDLSLNRFAKACLQQLFVDGIFHGDPHPGNILFRDDNHVAFLDFGIFGELKDTEREILAGQIECLALGEIRESFRFYSQQLVATEETDFRQLEREALEVLQRWHASLLKPGAPLKERHLARYTGEMIEVSRRNHLRYGLNFLLFWRALNNLNATLWMIAPDYDLIGQLRTFFAGIRPGLLERVQDALLSDTALRNWFVKINGFVEDFPQALAKLTSPAGAPRLKVVEEDSRIRYHRETTMLPLACLLVSLLIVLRIDSLGSWRILFLAVFSLGMASLLWKRAYSHSLFANLVPRLVKFTEFKNGDASKSGKRG